MKEKETNPKLQETVIDAHRFELQSVSGATITEEVPDGPTRESLQKDPLLTTLSVPWERPSAIALQSLLGIQKLLRRID